MEATNVPNGEGNTPQAPYEQVKDISPSIPFIRSKPQEGQEWCLLTYAIPREIKDDVYAIVKPMGMYATEKEADDAGRKALLTHQQSMKVVKVSKTGEWVLIKSPITMDIGSYDRMAKNGDVKRMVGEMNHDIDKARDEEEREMALYEREMKRQDEALSNKDSVEYYTMLRIKYDSDPGIIASYKHEIARMQKEIEKTEKLYIEHGEELIQIVVKHPEYPALFKDIKDKLSKNTV
jgi:hypothetical protein